MGKVSIERAVVRLLVPHLRDLGFTVESADGEKAWQHGRCDFKRVRNGREQWIGVGRHKFGHALGINVGRETQEGSYEYMDTRAQLPREVLQYETQEELELVVERLRQFIGDDVLAWLDR